MEVVQEDLETKNKSLHKCDVIKQQLAGRVLEVAQRMVDFISSKFKSDLLALKVEDGTTMITLENKVIYKHKYVYTIRNKGEALIKKG